MSDMHRGAMSTNPANGQAIGQYPFADCAHIDRLLSNMNDAFAAWREHSVENRSTVLRAMARVLRDRTERLAGLITSEMGKPVTAARAEVEKCAALCDWYAANASGLLANEAVDVGDDGRVEIRYRPLGVVLAVMPWNFPFWQAMRAAVPVIVGGNGFLLKHADNVQGAALALVDAWRDAGLPADIFANLNVHHRELPRLIADDRIAAVTVTAGVAAGSAIAAEAGRNLKKVVLELGGSDAFIVLKDVDLSAVVEKALVARFQNSGQVCIAAKRFIVEEPRYDAFASALAQGASNLRVGEPRLPETQMGPLARMRLRDELHAQVEASIAMGARLLTGGVIPAGPGAYYPPTVLADVSPEMPVACEETFGPVAAIIRARDADHAITLANASPFGLSGSIWGNDKAVLEELASRFDTGGVFVNGVPASDPRVPIGGVRHSGFGRELSHFGIREFCNAQLVWSRPPVKADPT